MESAFPVQFFCILSIFSFSILYFLSKNKVLLVFVIKKDGENSPSFLNFHTIFLAPADSGPSAWNLFFETGAFSYSANRTKG